MKIRRTISKLKRKPKTARRRLRIERYEERAMLAGPGDAPIADEATTDVPVIESTDYADAPVVLVTGTSLSDWGPTGMATDDIGIQMDLDVASVLNRIETQAERFRPRILAFDAGTVSFSVSDVQGLGNTISHSRLGEAADLSTTPPFVVGIQKIPDLSSAPDATNILPGQPAKSALSTGRPSFTGPAPSSGPARTTTVVTQLANDSETDTLAIATVFEGEAPLDEGQAVTLETLDFLLNREPDSGYVNYENVATRTENGTIPVNDSIIHTDTSQAAVTPPRLAIARPNPFGASESNTRTLVSVQYSEVRLEFETKHEMANAPTAVTNPRPIVPAGHSVNARGSVDLVPNLASNIAATQIFSFHTEVKQSVERFVGTPAVLLVAATLWTQTSLSARENAKENERSRLSIRDSTRNE